tara:strand:+ start:292 stop:1803 length:1512 start_codon:yes stop_codon:yes gene_type:complete
MSLLKAYLLRTDDPFVMIKCWYEDLTNTIWKANENPAKESYEDILQHIFREQGRAGGFKYKDPNTNTTRTLNQSTLTQALDKILSIKEVSEFLSSKSVAGQQPQRKTKEMLNSPSQLGWEKTNSGLKNTLGMNLFKIKDELKPYAKQTEYAQHINRIFAAIDKQLASLPKKPKDIRGFRGRAEDYDKSTKDAGFERKIKPYRKLLKLLEDVQKVNDQLSEGELDSTGKVVYPRKAIRALDKLFDEGPGIIFQLDEFVEADEEESKDSLASRFANSGIDNANEARDIEDEITKILQSNVKIMKLKGGLETMDLLDALQNHLYPQFKGKTTFRNRSEAESIMGNITQARSRRMRQKKDKAKRMSNFDTSQSSRDARFNDRIKSAEKFLIKQYFHLGKTEDTFKGRKRAAFEDDVRDTERGIRQMKKEMADFIPSDESQATKFRNKYYKAFDDMPDKEAEMQKGRELKSKLNEKDIEEQTAALEEEHQRMFEELMAGGKFTRGLGQ